MKCLADCLFNNKNECTLKSRYINKSGLCSEIIFKEKTRINIMIEKDISRDGFYLITHKEKKIILSKYAKIGYAIEELIENEGNNN